MIKVGIIGFGYMGHFHYQKAKEIDKVEVTTICDIAEDKLALGRELGLKCFHSTDADKFMKEDINLVVICTQNQFHSDYAIRAMKAKKNVLCEKPVTLTVPELEEVVHFSRETGMLFTVHHQRRFDKDYLLVADMIKSGQIGKIHTIESRIMGERGVCFGWRADPAAGGGMLYDWGVHLIDQMLCLFEDEKVLTVHARLNSILTPVVDDYVELNLGFTNGMHAKIMICTFALQKLPRWFVFGDRGTMKIDDISCSGASAARICKEVKGFDSVVGKKGLGPSRTMAPLEPGYIELLKVSEVDDNPMMFWENLVDTLEGKSSPLVSKQDLIRQMKIVEAAFVSSERNKIIHVEI